MIYARVWRGRTRRDQADDYERYWLAQGSKPLLDKGARSVQMLREDREHDTEFVTISHLEQHRRHGRRAGPDANAPSAARP